MCLILAQNDDRKKRPRTAFSASQIKALETEFERGKYLSVAKRTALAKQLRLTETQVIILIAFSYDEDFFPLDSHIKIMLIGDSLFRLKFGFKIVERNGSESIRRTLRHWHPNIMHRSALEA